MATSSALLLVCLSVSDRTAILIVLIPGKITPAPRVGCPVIWEPSVHEILTFPYRGVYADVEMGVSG